jgi:hypothetical protein
MKKDYSDIKSVDKLKTLLEKKDDEYRKLINSPKTRQSAYNGIPIHSVQNIREYENIYEEMSFIRAEIAKRQNKESGEQLHFIYSNNLWVVITPFIVENGIMKSGGYLDNYFLGKSAEEHEGYVIGRHGAKIYKFDYLEKEVNFVSDNSDENRIFFKAKIKDRYIKVKTRFKLSVNCDTYFYFEYKDLKIKVEDGQISKPMQKVAKYACAYLYKMTFAEHKNICIRDL